MRARHPRTPRVDLPTRWLMTDERMGDALWLALARLPRGAGVVFRHHATPPAERRRLFVRVRGLARRRGLVLVRAGDERMRGEQGVHNRRGAGIVTWAAHSRREAIAGLRAGASVVFVSPVLHTRSHPGARALGRVRAAWIAATTYRQGVAVIALGGMDERRFARLGGPGFVGYAAIDAWMRTR